MKTVPSFCTNSDGVSGLSGVCCGFSEGLAAAVLPYKPGAAKPVPSQAAIVGKFRRISIHCVAGQSRKQLSSDQFQCVLFFLRHFHLLCFCFGAVSFLLAGKTSISLLGLR